MELINAALILYVYSPQLLYQTSTLPLPPSTSTSTPTSPQHRVLAPALTPRRRPCSSGPSWPRQSPASGLAIRPRPSYSAAYRKKLPVCALSVLEGEDAQSEREQQVCAKGDDGPERENGDDFGLDLGGEWDQLEEGGEVDLWRCKLWGELLGVMLETADRGEDQEEGEGVGGASHGESGGGVG